MIFCLQQWVILMFLFSEQENLEHAYQKFTALHISNCMDMVPLEFSDCVTYNKNILVSCMKDFRLHITV